MTKTISCDWGSVSYEDTPEIRNVVFERVLKYFVEYEAFSGESIMQSDAPSIAAPEVFSDIADDILKFTITDRGLI